MAAELSRALFMDGKHEILELQQRTHLEHKSGCYLGGGILGEILIKQKRKNSILHVNFCNTKAANTIQASFIGTKTKFTAIWLSLVK